MSEASRSESSPQLRLVWDWPLRIWHWLFALCITGSLTSGLMGEIAWMDWHMRLGYAALALLLFRLGWGLWGSRNARFATFRTTPAAVLAHFRGDGGRGPRTAPGVLLATLLMLLIAVQASTGLFTTDDIFTDGPLVRHADSDTVETLSGIHHQLYWGILALVGVHLTAHVVYAGKRDPTPMSMFTGKKWADVQPPRHLPWRALATALLATAVVWGALVLV